MDVKMVPGTVEKVPVDWLMQNIRKSIDGCNDPDTMRFDPRKLLERKVGDESMGPLFASVLEAGFTVPICLYRPTDRSGFIYPEDEWCLGNGHHRLTLAILMCADTIPVFWADEDDYMSTHKSEGKNLGYWGDFMGWVPNYAELMLENRSHLRPKKRGPKHTVVNGDVFYKGKHVGNILSKD